MPIITGMSTVENIMQLIGLIIVFIIILVATYYTTKWVGKTSLSLGRNRNITIIETCKIGQSKFIQIIKLGEKYIAVGISKDHIEYLTELDEEQLQLQELSESANPDFKDIFSKVITKHKLKKRK